MVFETSDHKKYKEVAPESQEYLVVVCLSWKDTKNQCRKKCTPEHKVGK